MSQSRLEIARDSGLVTWPGDRVLAFRPDPDTLGLPAEGLTVLHGNKPHFDVWRSRNVAVETNWVGSASAGYVQVPRSKAFARKLFAESVTAVEPGGPVVIDGQKTDGVESILKEIKPLFDGVEVLSKAHGKLFVFNRPVDPPPAIDVWRRARSGFDDWRTALSGFSAERIDPGSALLADHLPKRINGTILDMGAGWGFLARGILKTVEVERLDLLEAEFDALQAAKSNISDERARFLWEDALNWTPDCKYDLVVCNPPFHSGRSADHSLGQKFINAASGCLSAKGMLALVANRHLPYERTLADAFGHVQTVAEAQGYKVFHAQKPKGTRRRRR